MARSACAATDACNPCGVRLPAAGVQDGEPLPVPQPVVGDPIAGDAGDVLHDRLAAADDPIDQGRLADVGPADDGDHRRRATRLLVAVGLVPVLPGGELTLVRPGAIHPSRPHRRRRNPTRILLPSPFSFPSVDVAGRMGARSALSSSATNATSDSWTRAVASRYRRPAGAGRHVEGFAHQNVHPGSPPPVPAVPRGTSKRDRQHRGARPHRQPARPVEHLADVPGAAGPLGEHADRPARLELGQRVYQHGSLRGITIDRVLADGSQQPAKGALDRLRLHQERHPTREVAEQHRARP